MQTKSNTDIEQELLDQINQGKFGPVVFLCEEYEYTCAEFPPSKNTTPYYGIHLLSYLILNDLNAARFLWKRIPKKVKETDAELVAIWSIAKHIWKKSYSEIYTAFNAFNWGPVNVTLIQALSESFRSRTFDLLSNAYSSISLADVALHLGISDQDAINLSARHGWKFDAASRMLAPIPNKPAKVQETGLDQLQQLTEYVIWLEQK